MKRERRAPELLEQLQGSLRGGRILSHEMTRAAIHALAVAEEDAAGGLIVMAPSYGSAGILSSALNVLEERLFLPTSRVHDALLVAGPVGAFVPAKASIAGVEVGCQGEVGTACAMAAAVSGLSAASLSLLGSGRHEISFDRAVASMRHIGTDTDRKHKETSLGGLALSADPGAPPA